jgi:cytoskeletal protein RodZ
LNEFLSMKAFGAALKEAREQAGLTLEEIHERTRINLKHLRAIERGDFPSVPQTYVRAFIREYARTVGLDETVTLQQYTELANELKGIPKPPDTLDHSHLTPQIDDSVEIVEEQGQRITPRHVEFDGKPEVEREEYEPLVRRSKYVSDDHKAVDLPSAPRHEKQIELYGPEKPAAEKEKRTTGEPSDPPLSPADLSVKETSSPIPPPEPEKQHPKEADAPSPPPGSKKSEAEMNKPPQVRHSSDTGEGSKRWLSKLRKETTTQPAADKPAVASDTDKPKKEKKPPKKRTPEDDEQRRLLIIGSLITLAIAIGIYGIWYFSTETEATMAVADSTRTQPNVYAERFIDSTDFIPDEPEILPDTTTGTVQPPPVNERIRDNAFEREDSLVLEAFSSTPVYYSLRMDTTKTEKGFLTSNEHRLWKAKDRFVISLGDAGAMTFFLNGKQLKPLGGEGLAINNFVINRKTLEQE